MMRPLKVLAFFAAFSLSGGALGSEYVCIQDHYAETGVMSFDKARLQLKVTVNTLANRKSSHVCQLEKLGGQGAVVAFYGIVECNVTMDQIGARHVKALDDELDGWIDTDAPIKGSDSLSHYRANFTSRWDDDQQPGKRKYVKNVFDCVDYVSGK